jgi:hypothetical protein
MGFRISKRGKRILQVLSFIIGGYLGEFSFVISVIRSLEHMSRSGYFSAVPNANYNIWYGFSWRVSYSIGASAQLMAVMFSVLVIIFWSFYEYIKGEV